MAATVARLQGEDWQDWANQLLSHHYGPTEYQRVPDNDRGDAGLEGYTVSDGHAYQAYGCEEPLSTKKRYENQRNKMTRDVKKFIDNKDTLTRVFGTTRITRWVLFVPYCDSKEIVAHASTKTAEVLGANLPYVENGFQVMVCHEDDFREARQALLLVAATVLEVAVDEATPEQVTDWAASNDDLVATVDEKIAKLPSLISPAQRQAFRDTVLKWYLEGRELLDALRNYPQTYEKIVRAKSHRENYLASAALAAGNPAQEFNNALEQLLTTFRQEVQEVSGLSAESLAHEAVADWLIRCPLDFYSSSNNG